MKNFRDVKVGDVIYYYSHGKMIPQVVHKIEIIEKVEHITYSWNPKSGYDKKISAMIIQAGKAKERTVSWAPDHNIVEWGGVWHFSCREAAEDYIKSLKYKASQFIGYAHKLLDKYNRLYIDYDAAFLQDFETK